MKNAPQNADFGLNSGVLAQNSLALGWLARGDR